MKGLGHRVKKGGTELAVVIFGVLIALWADGRVAERADRRDLREHLGAVREELVVGARALGELLSEQEAELSALQALAAIHGSGDLPADSILLPLVAQALTNVSTFEPSLGAFTDLDSSGLLRSAEGAELRLVFASLMQRLNQAATETVVNQTGPQQRIFDPFVLDELPFVWDQNARLNGLKISRSSRPDWEPLMTPRGKGLIAMRFDFLSSMTMVWHDLREDFVTAVELIDQELAR